jgi:hypothetical protein
MMQKSATVSFGGVALLVALLAAGLWALTRELPAPSRRLPDGSILALKAVDYGKSHPLVEQRVWQKLLQPVLPISLRSQEIIPMGTPADRLVLWFLRDRAPALPWDPRRCAEVIDAHGCCLSQGYVSTGPARRGRYSQVAILPAFPRRDDQFRVRLYEPGSVGPGVEFMIPNPRPGPYPHWQPETLPAQRRRGAVGVRLTSLETGVPPLSHRHPGDQAANAPSGIEGRRPESAALRWTRASFRVFMNGRPTDRWQLTSLAVSDATGNMARYPEMESCSFSLKPARSGPSGYTAVWPVSREWRRGTTSRLGEVWMQFPGLCPRESAWKLGATFSYVGPESMQHADLHWTVPGVPVPGRGNMAGTVAVSRWPGLTLRIIGVSGRGGWEAEALPDPSTRARVFVSATPGDDLTLALTATDERGRSFGLCPGGSSDQYLFHKWWFDLSPPSDVKRLTLRFSIWRGRTVEFLAQPTAAPISSRDPFAPHQRRP